MVGFGKCGRALHFLTTAAPPVMNGPQHIDFCVPRCSYLADDQPTWDNSPSSNVLDRRHRSRWQPPNREVAQKASWSPTFAKSHLCVARWYQRLFA